MKKASGGDGIPVELFQILKDDAVKVMHSICTQIWKTQQWPQDWKRSIFIPIPKKGNAKECSNYRWLQSMGSLRVGPTEQLSFFTHSTGIPSPPLALFIVMLPNKSHLTLHSRMSESR